MLVHFMLQAMFWVVVTLVFLNTCVLATEHHHQPDWLGNFQAIQNNHFLIGCISLFMLFNF